MTGDATALDAVRQVADAVLYEGYILYPYRASAQKNRSRWQFGVVMAPGYAAADFSERSFAATECVLEHSGAPGLHVVLRFLQVQRRSTEGAADAGTQAWDEAVEREIEFTVSPADLLGADLLGAGQHGTDQHGADQLGAGLVRPFSVPDGTDREPSPGPGGGQVVRRRRLLAGTVTVRATPVPGPWRAVRLGVRVDNLTPADPVPADRDEALPTALVAAHLILTASDGEFLSMTEPPEWAKDAVAGCQNTGLWPVLAGPAGGRRVMLAAPIILYDHPELAPESPGQLYDGTEIDEILTLRTLALSAQEKREARATDPRAAALIDRVESLDAQAMGRLHGTIRGTGSGGAAGGMAAGGPDVPWDYDPAVPWWDPEADASVSPDTDEVLIGGVPVARGSLVRLRPGARRADAQDMFLAGRTAEVQAVLTDVEDRPYLAVSLTDDPDADLRIAHGRFLYFMPDEVEPVPAGGNS